MKKGQILGAAAGALAVAALAVGKKPPEPAKPEAAHIEVPDSGKGGDRPLGGCGAKRNLGTPTC